MRTISAFSTLALGVALLAGPLAGMARAGLPECGNFRLEDAKRCEIRGKINCTAGCSELGVYKKACATKLHTVCRRDCTLSEQPTCTDSCTESCSADCSRGVNVICSHNCYRECVGSCDVKCTGAANVPQCRATCEATCDGECDIKCKPVVNASCYQHCVECCGGSCKAQANMDCQTTCQDKTFEDCEHEFRANCQASCSGQGALFCDGKYVLSGSDIPACAKAIVERGIASNFNAQGAVMVQVDTGGKVGCRMAPLGGRDSGSRASVSLVWLLAGLAALGLRVRKRSHGMRCARMAKRSVPTVKVTVK